MAGLMIRCKINNDNNVPKIKKGVYNTLNDFIISRTGGRVAQWVTIHHWWPKRYLKGPRFETWQFLTGRVRDVAPRPASSTAGCGVNSFIIKYLFPFFFSPLFFPLSLK